MASRILLCVGLAVLSGARASAQAPAGPPVRTLWTSDAVDVQVGDLVTILIDEYTLASADRDDWMQNQRDRDVAASLSGTGVSLRAHNDITQTNRGAAERRNRFQAEVGAQVVEVLPGGVVRIEGTRRLMIDDHEQTVTVRGLVRSLDISSTSTVESWRVAQAELLYESNRELGRDGSIWAMLFKWIIP
jgi:flagellar L-ring protein precursor FlgH